MDKDWEARFKPSELRPRSHRVLWEIPLEIAAPFGPWWLGIALGVGVAGLFTFMFRAAKSK